MSGSVTLEFDEQGKIKNVRNLRGVLPDDTVQHLKDILGWSPEASSQETDTSSQETDTSKEPSSNPDSLLDVDQHAGIVDPDAMQEDPATKREDAQAQATNVPRKPAGKELDFDQKAPKDQEKDRESLPSSTTPPFLNIDAGNATGPAPVGERTMRPQLDGAMPVIRDTSESSSSMMYAQKDKGNHVNAPSEGENLFDEMAKFEEENEDNESKPSLTSPEEKNSEDAPVPSDLQDDQGFQTKESSSKTGIAPPPNISPDKWNTLSQEEQVDFYKLQQDLRGAISSNNAEDARRFTGLLNKYQQQMETSSMMREPMSPFAQSGAASPEAATSPSKKPPVPEKPNPISAQPSHEGAQDPTLQSTPNAVQKEQQHIESQHENPASTTPATPSPQKPSLFQALDEISKQGLTAKSFSEGLIYKSLIEDALSPEFSYGGEPFYMYGHPSTLGVDWQDVVEKAKKQHQVAPKSAHSTKPSSGHKYIRKEWKGTYWDYTYEESVPKGAKMANTKEGLDAQVAPKENTVVFLPLHEALQEGGVAHREAKNAAESYFKTIKLHEKGLTRNGQQIVSASPESITVAQGKDNKAVRLTSNATYLARVGERDVRTRKQLLQSLGEKDFTSHMGRRKANKETVKTFKVGDNDEALAIEKLDVTEHQHGIRSPWRVKISDSLKDKWGALYDSTRQEYIIPARSQEDAENIARYVSSVEKLKKEGGTVKLKDVFSVNRKEFRFGQDKIAGFLERGAVPYELVTYQSELGEVYELRPQLTDILLKELVTKELKGIVSKAADRALRSVGIAAPTPKQKKDLMVAAITEVHRALAVRHVARQGDKERTRFLTGFSPAKGDLAAFLKSSLMSDRYWHGALKDEALKMVPQISLFGHEAVEEGEDWSESERKVWIDAQLSTYASALRASNASNQEQRISQVKATLGRIRTYDDAVSFARSQRHSVWATVPTLLNTQDLDENEEDFERQVNAPVISDRDETVIDHFSELHNLIEDSDFTPLQKELMAEYLVAWEEGPELGDSVATHMIRFMQDHNAFQGRSDSEIKRAALDVVAKMSEDEDVSKVLRDLRTHLDSSVAKSIQEALEEMESQYLPDVLSANDEYKKAKRVLEHLRRKMIWSALEAEAEKEAVEKSKLLKSFLGALKSGEDIQGWAKKNIKAGWFLFENEDPIPVRSGMELIKSFTSRDDVGYALDKLGF